MKKYHVLFLLLLPINSFSRPDNLYLELKKNTIEIGEYQGKNFKKKRLKEYSYQSENIAEIQALFFENQEENVLYYFHCLYGGVRFFHKNSLQRLNQDNQSHKIISIVWHANYLAYKKNWEQSIEQSQCLQQLFFQLWSIAGKNNSVLCHSMGHRIFEGVMQGVDSQGFNFEKIIFAAGDLDVDVFENNLKKLPEISERIVIYIHLKDRLLKASTKRHDRKRLGLHGLENNEILLKIDNIERVNVTNSSGKRCIRTTNHSYFKGDDLVLADIMALLKNDLEKRLIYLENLEGNIWKMQ